MPDIGFSIGMLGGAATLFSITRVTALLNDLTPFWPMIHEQLRIAEGEAFATEGAVGGLPPWLPLTDNYKAWKDKQYPGQPLLQLTGRLVDSLTGDTEDSIYEEYPTYMVYGTQAGIERGTAYPVYLQDGTTKMVARPIFDEVAIAAALEPALFAGAGMIASVWHGYGGSTDTGAGGD